VVKVLHDSVCISVTMGMTIYCRIKWSGHKVLVTGPRNLRVFLQATPAASQDFSILGLAAPAILHRETASLHVVAPEETVLTRNKSRIVIAGLIMPVPPRVFIQTVFRRSLWSGY
jgi:hypothetical protein